MTATRSSPEALAHWISEQRWFDRTDMAAGPAATRSRTLAPAPLPGVADADLQIVETAVGHRYQLVVPRIASPEPDVAADPTVAAALVDLAVQERSSSTALGTLTGHWLTDEARPGSAPARPLGAEQSNTSVVVGGTHVLKIFRRLARGQHPEVEIGQHLHDGAAASPDAPPLPVAALTGWYELVDDEGLTTLGVVNRLVPGALDGWSLALSALAADPPELLHRLRDLGVAVARLQGALARPSTGTDLDGDRFGRAPLDVASVDGVAAGTVAALKELDETVGAATVARLTERTSELAADVDRADLGVAIRTHGDLHLGQTVVGPAGWVILDFEGEPTRPLEERRRHHSPLRDVAGLLRSLSYAVETVRRSGAGAVTDGWEPAARAAVLDGYLATVDPALLPRSATSIRQLLTLFEVEKAVYEVGYETAHRPDWVELPLRALDRY